MKFKTSAPFIGESFFRDFSAASCHPVIFIDLANAVLANRCPTKTICTVSGSDSTHMEATGPMTLKTKLGPIFVNSSSRNFAAPSCHPCNSYDLVNNAWSVVFCRDDMHGLRELQYSSACHLSKEFQKLGTFYWKILLPGFCCPQLPSKHFFLPCNYHPGLKTSVETRCTF